MKVPPMAAGGVKIGSMEEGDVYGDAVKNGPGSSRVPSETDPPSAAALIPIAPAHKPTDTELFNEALAAVQPEDEEFVLLSMSMLRRVVAIMNEQGIDQKTLAKRMKKKESEVSRWLCSLHNVTMRNMARLNVALGKRVFIVPEFMDPARVSDHKGTTEGSGSGASPNGAQRTPDERDGEALRTGTPKSSPA